MSVLFIERNSANKTVCASIIDRELIDRISLGIIHRNLVTNRKVVRNFNEVPREEQTHPGGEP